MWISRRIAMQWTTNIERIKTRSIKLKHGKKDTGLEKASEMSIFGFIISLRDISGVARMEYALETRYIVSDCIKPGQLAG